jgi:hypothetical protein
VVDADAKKPPARFPARGTLREFQFPESTVSVIRASACQTETEPASRAAATRAACHVGYSRWSGRELLDMSLSGSDPKRRFATVN